MAFPAIRSAVGTALAASASHAVAMPAAIEPGDLLLMVVALDGAPVITTPAGWTLLVEGASGMDVKGAAFFKIAAGSEDGGAATLELSASEVLQAWTVALSGAGTPEAAASSGDSPAPDSGSLTPSGGARDYLWLSCACINGNETASAVPSGYTQQFNDSEGGAGTCALAAASRELYAADENPGAFALDDPAEWVALTIAVAPAGAGGPAARALHQYRIRRT